jgi:hypothetical protein
MTDAQVLAIRPHGRGAFTLTPSLCSAIGTDAANVQMRKAGRQRWNDDDMDIAIEVQMRHMVLGGFLPPEIYVRHVGEPFPFVLGNDGSWIKLMAAA